VLHFNSILYAADCLIAYAYADRGTGLAVLYVSSTLAAILFVMQVQPYSKLLCAQISLSVDRSGSAPLSGTKARRLPLRFRR
jgi:hypothetical protein